jgi:hypothetical protein
MAVRVAEVAAPAAAIANWTAVPGGQVVPMIQGFTAPECAR